MPIKKLSRKGQQAEFCLHHIPFLLGLVLNPEDGGDMFLRNVG
jgi:hypothetical protein